MIEFFEKDYEFLIENPDLELLKKMKKETSSSIIKKIYERTSNLIVEYMVLHGKIKAEDFDNILKLMTTSEEEEQEK